VLNATRSGRGQPVKFGQLGRNKIPPPVRSRSGHLCRRREKRIRRPGITRRFAVGRRFVFLGGTAFPDCPNHPGIATISEPIVDGNTITTGKSRSSDCLTPRFHVGDQVIFVGVGTYQGSHRGVVGVIEGSLLITFIGTRFDCLTESGSDVLDLNWSRFGKNPGLRERAYPSRSRDDGLVYTS
jgi:hypothetical protein